MSSFNEICSRYRAMYKSLDDDKLTHEDKVKRINNFRSGK